MSEGKQIDIHDFGIKLNAKLIERGLHQLDSNFGRYGPTTVNMVAEFNWWLKKCPNEYEKVFEKPPREIGFSKPQAPPPIEILRKNSAHYLSSQDAGRLEKYWLYYAERDAWPEEVLWRDRDKEFLALLEELRSEL